MKRKQNMTISVKDKTVIITGATGYFGRHMASALLAAGARVILIARDPSKLTRDSRALMKKYGKNKISIYAVDFYDHQAFVGTLKTITRRYTIDALINNAYDLSKRTGFNTPKGSLEKMSYEEWHNSFLSGIYWPALAIQIVGAQFKKRKAGSIINISSMYGLVSPDPALYAGKKFLNPPSYGVVKAGLLALTRYTASFWGKYNVRCNAIAPGPFPNTESSSQNSVGRKDTFLDRLKEKTLLGRVGVPRDLIGALIFLVSDASQYMNGSVISVDGGWTTK